MVQIVNLNVIVLRAKYIPYRRSYDSTRFAKTTNYHCLTPEILNLFKVFPYFLLAMEVILQ